MSAGVVRSERTPRHLPRWRGLALLIALVALCLVRPASAETVAKASALRAAGVKDRYPDDDAQPAPHWKIGHGAYFEALGPGVLYSVNYELRVESVAFRVGYSAWQFCFLSCADIRSYPLAVTALPGTGPHYLEVGAGATPMHFEHEQHLLLVPQLGYRYMPRKVGFLFRATLTPIITRSRGQWYFLPFAGLSFGVAG